MMNVIAYHPPKSVSFSHGPRARSPRKAWAAIQTFLQEHTIGELREPIELEVWGAGQWTDSKVLDSARKKASEIFGTVTNISGEFWSWKLESSKLEEALEFVFAYEIQPKQPLGPVNLYLRFSFAWRDMPNPSIRTTHFNSGNLLGITLSSHKVIIQPTFLFGASDTDSIFSQRLDQLEQLMPFKPKDSYYYRLESKKTGKGEKLVKLKEGWKHI